MGDIQRIPLPAWKLALLFSESFSWSHHWSWLHQRSGHREPAAWIPCAHNSLMHTGISGPMQGCLHSCTSGLIPGLTPPSVTSICNGFDPLFCFLQKSITNNNCCLHRPDCHLCCLLRGTEADRREVWFWCYAKNCMFLDLNPTCRKIWNSCQ